MDDKQRFLARFQSEVKKGLADIKFFVRKDRVSVTDLFAEANRFEDNIAGRECKIIEKIDIDNSQIRYDAAFE